MIGVVDYGAGNVGSVLKATEYLGYPACRVQCPEQLTGAEKIIFPGQGHFGAMMEGLRERRLLDSLAQWLRSGRPFLGICLGLQALYEASDEAPGASGLGLLRGRVQRLQGIFKIPHVGWSQLEIAGETRIMSGIPPGSFVYFCHSYYGPITEQTVAATEYGQRFTAAAELGNVFGVQFHPEKSGEVGLKVLKDFLQL